MIQPFDQLFIISIIPKYDKLSPMESHHSNKFVHEDVTALPANVNPVAYLRLEENDFPMEFKYLFLGSLLLPIHDQEWE